MFRRDLLARLALALLTSMLRLRPAPAPEKRLSDYYCDEFKPSHLADVSQLTRASFDQSIALWKRLTGDPPRSHIDAAVVDRFVEALGRVHGPRNRTLHRVTVARHTLHVLAVLRANERATQGPRDVPAA